ncbi:MAG: hypothetical protein CMC21_04555 [Flavobacteriaceae bacterium]|nr:hypothetical protein [Flavobacteriaceae bacterium]
MNKILTLLMFSVFIISCSKKDETIQDDDLNSIVCIEIYDPVCGSNGITYSNSCFAEAAGVYEYSSGECGS